MKIQTSELTGVALDWAVAKCESQTKKNFRLLDRIKIYTGGTVGLFRMPKSTMHSGSWYKPSTDWSQGGPIIEREKISIMNFGEPRGIPPEAFMGSPVEFKHKMYGPTLLIAAMRCYVASKLGDEVEVPEELE